MSETNPIKPDDFSFAQCAEEFFICDAMYKIPQSVMPEFGSKGFLYLYTEPEENFMFSFNNLDEQVRIETITMFLLINAAIEGEI